MNAPPVNAVDIVAAIVVLFTTLRGLRRKLSGELSSLVSGMTALALGWWAYRPLGTWLAAHTRLESEAAHALGFVLSAVSILLVMVLVGFLGRRVMKVIFDESFDRPAGGVAGFVGGVVGVILALLCVTLWPNPFLREHFVERSLLGRTVHRWAPGVRERVEEEMPAARPALRRARRGTE